MRRALIVPGKCLIQGRHLRALLRAQGVGRPMPLMSAVCAQCGPLTVLLQDASGMLIASFADLAEAEPDA